MKYVVLNCFGTRVHNAAGSGQFSKHNLIPDNDSQFCTDDINVAYRYAAIMEKEYNNSPYSVKEVEL